MPTASQRSPRPQLATALWTEASGSPTGLRARSSELQRQLYVTPVLEAQLELTSETYFLPCVTVVP